MSAIWEWIVMLLVVASLSGCASKSLKTTMLDDRGNPVVLEAHIVYFCADQKTNDFAAEAPGGLKIKFAGQESNAKTEVALEFLKLLNSLPTQ